MSIPINWDPDITYTNTMLYQAGNAQQYYQFENPIDGLYLKKVPMEHPAFGGMGVYTSRKIYKDEYICNYAGIYRLPEMGVGNLYTFNVPNGFVIDAQHTGNIARYINDFRGTNIREPNVNTYHDDSDEFGVQYVVMQANKVIEPGTELLVYYGKDYVFPSKPVFDKNRMLLYELLKYVDCNVLQQWSDGRVDDVLHSMISERKPMVDPLSYSLSELSYYMKKRKVTNIVL